MVSGLCAAASSSPNEEPPARVGGRPQCARTDRSHPRPSAAPALTIRGRPRRSSARPAGGDRGARRPSGLVFLSRTWGAPLPWNTSRACAAVNPSGPGRWPAPVAAGTSASVERERTEEHPGSSPDDGEGHRSRVPARRDEGQWRGEPDVRRPGVAGRGARRRGRPDQQVRRGRDRQRRHPAAGELTAELASRGCKRRKPQREVGGQERRAVNRQRVSGRMVAQDRHALRDRGWESHPAAAWPKLMLGRSSAIERTESTSMSTGAACEGPPPGGGGETEQGVAEAAEFRGDGAAAEKSLEFAPCLACRRGRWRGRCLEAGRKR